MNAAIAALQQGRLDDAQRLVQQRLLEQPEDPRALEVAAEIAVADGRTEAAIQWYGSAIKAHRRPPAMLFTKLGRQWMQRGRPHHALQVLGASLKHHGNDPSLRADFAGLAANLGMERAAEPHLRWRVRHGHGGLNELIMLGDVSRPQTSRAICRDALKRYPNDLRPQYALARSASYESRWDEVADKLEPVVERHRSFVPASAYYGLALVHLQRSEAIERWASQLPADITSHPQYWLAAGIWAENQGRGRQAARAFWEAARRDENNGEALTRLSAALAQLGQTEQSQLAAQRAGRIANMRDAMESFFQWRNDSQRAALEVARAMATLGRRWEAVGWARAALSMTQDLDDSAPEVHEKLRAELTPQTPWQTPEELAAAKMDLSEFPQVGWSRSEAARLAKRGGARPTAIRFADEAQRRGLKHTCEIADEDDTEAGIWIYQSGAGGAATIDYDADGWPDMYLTTVDGTPRKSDSAPNRLFRNRSGQFVDVTAATGVGSTRFSQGVAAGDFNGDGLTDLLVANIGRNQLYQNNGDGTFRDVTERAGLQGDYWTTSVAIADIDRDGHADLFEVGYCAGDEPFEQECFNDDLSQHRSCGPLVFPAERDRVWRGRGDGTFVEMTDRWLDQPDPGHGLGLVVGRLDEQPGIDIYVANDMSANHLWSASGEREDSFRLSEQATVRGLAFNARSLSQASMGIAAGDGDGDSDLDLFLTHFTDEYNTFYEQVRPGTWVDRSTPVGLTKPSLKTLGYGTEWIDTDNDGASELIVANGHVDDFSHVGDPFRMPMQLFQRDSQGRWNQLDAEPLGEYFQTRRLGRALVTLDANRDGMTDALVTHLFDPVALLVNRTEVPSRSVTFYLKATGGHRDAIGAEVTVIAGDTSRTAQLIAGDGYQCSNERALRFGIGRVEQIDRVTIEWPSGAREEMTHLEGGHEYLLVEGAGEAFRLSR